MKSVRNTAVAAAIALWAVSLFDFAAAFAAPVTVDLSADRQMIRGFGGMNHPLWIGDLTAAQRATVFGNDANQLGFTVLRMYLSENSNDWQREVATARYASERGHIVFASPWHPPQNMRESMTRPSDGRSYYRLNPSSYAAYTNHLNSFVEYMYNNGVNLYSVSVQNEPDYGINDYSDEGWCSWTAGEVLNYMRDHAGNIDKRVKVMTPEPFQYEDWTNGKPILSGILNNPAALANTDIFGTHLYGTRLPAFDYPLFREKGAGKELWMTEVYVPNSNANSNNDWPEALQVAEHVHNSLAVGGFQAYVWWYIRRSYSPLSEDGTISKRGWMMAHFSKFVRPGYVRVEATRNPETDVFVSAYKGDNKVVIVAVNKSESVVYQDFTINNGTVTSVERWRTSANENMVRTDADIAVTNGSFGINLQPQSVATLVGAIGGSTDIKPGAANAARKNASLMTVRGRTLTVNESPGTKVWIRVMNLNGKVVASFNVDGGSSVSLKKVPAGMYIIETRRAGDGVRTASNVVLR